MGYTTEFKGVLKFKTEPTVSVLREIKKFFGQDMRELDPHYAKDNSINYIDLELADDLSGVQWDGSEKCYGMVESVNWVIWKMLVVDADFGLTGEMKASGEDSDDRWILRIVNGKAEKVRVEWTGLLVECPDCKCRFRVDAKTGKLTAGD